MMEPVYMHYSIRIILTIVVIIALFYILFKFKVHRNDTNVSLEVMKERYERAKDQQGKK